MKPSRGVSWLPARPAVAFGLLLVVLCPGHTARAGSMALDDGWTLDYILNLTYSAAVRTESSNEALTNGINSDDGNRNFDNGSLINNRAAALGEINLEKDRFGVLVRGSAFYDRVYAHNDNDHDAPARVNKNGEHDRFTQDAVDRLGERARLLDAYVYGAWAIGSTDLSVRVGEQVVSWGESVFFPNMSGAMAPSDATKSNVPGTEVKEVLLPTGQVYLQWGLTRHWSLSGFYQYDYERTELKPVGGYFSSTDLVGPGAEFFILQVPPSPQLPPNAPSRVEIPRYAADKADSDTQWGVRTSYQIGPGSTLGLHYLKYHAKNPTGARFFNTGPQAVLGGQSNYRPVYAQDIDMTAVTLTTGIGGVALAGELSYRDGAGVAVDAPGLFRQPQATPTTADVWQANLNASKLFTPTMFWDQLVLIGELAGTSVDEVDPLMVGGTEYDTVSNSEEAAAFQGSAVFTYKQVFPGWDLSVEFAHTNAIEGSTAVAATLGSLTGEGDRRYNLTFGFEYLQNLRLAVGYNYFSGDPEGGDATLTDRDFATFSAKYSF